MKSHKPQTKHQIKSEATRRELLQAAESIFARDGFERAQIDEIAQEAGRTRGAVYAQFKTKEQLFFALLEQQMLVARDELRALTDSEEGSGHQARLAALRAFYSKPKNTQAAILDLEMKLYALRHPDVMPELRESYLRLYRAREFEGYFGVRQAPGTSKIVNRVFALGALKSGLLLTLNFLATEVSAKEASRLLSEVFDGLFPTAPSPADAAGVGGTKKANRQSA